LIGAIEANNSILFPIGDAKDGWSPMLNGELRFFCE
jgi:hypothetical protein